MKENIQKYSLVKSIVFIEIFKSVIKSLLCFVLTHHFFPRNFLQYFNYIRVNVFKYYKTSL